MKKAIPYLLFSSVVIGFLAAYGAALSPMIGAPSQPKLEVWQYQGHDMLRYEYKGEISVCHSPECRKCIQVYD